MALRVQAYLRILTGPKKGGVYVLEGLSVYEIGKGEGCQVRIVDDDRCSSHHARIYRKENVWTFFDLNSDNGSSINDIKMDKRDLEGGEIIRIGRTELQFSFEVPSGSVSAEGVPEVRGAAPPPLPSTARAPLGPPVAVVPPAAPPLPPPVPPSPSDPVAADLAAERTMPLQPLRRRQLLVVDGDVRDIGRECYLDGMNQCLIGRALNCDLVLNDGKISRVHCRIDRRGEEFVLTDLGSSNGTVVNGERVVKTVFKPGDYFRLGYTIISYQLIEKVQPIQTT